MIECLRKVRLAMVQASSVLEACGREDKGSELRCAARTISEWISEIKEEAVQAGEGDK